MHTVPMTSSPCPLCGSLSVFHFLRDPRRDYFRCGRCRLINVPPVQQLGAEAEAAEYTLHQNDPADPGYRNFLSRLLIPLTQRLAPASTGLDFGSGPGPTLSLMLTAMGHRMSLYDPFFSPDTAVFQHTYDFICATEVVEHLRSPGQELNRLWAILKPAGWLGIMTKLAMDDAAFSRWHYKNDLTHISFFSRPTFLWLAHHWHARLIMADKDVVLIQKPCQYR